ncbi:MAG: Gfo/Idh/MocA family oxidoreductase [Lentisphaeria bacterium]|nr:Gfo/Idh/MocA family oxidoreductase [Lentisphaeria bacterium]
MTKKRYAVCGVSARAIGMYIRPMMQSFSHCAELVAMLDIDPLRFQVCKDLVPEVVGKNIAEYTVTLENWKEVFDRMIEEQKVDAVLVVCKDCHHVDYIVRGLELGLDVISEKPMTTNIADARRVVEAEDKSKGKLICTFNYRYNPIHRKLRELIVDGKIGRVTHVDLTWYIDIKHGSSYFNRWNRMRENSGSLSIHKSSHHFDLVSWWIDGIPEYVHAFGALNHYGPNGEFNPSKKEGRHCNDCPELLKCAYKKRWATRNSTIFVADDHINAYETKVKQFSEYRPDMCIFDSEINIYDTFVVNVKYRNGALLNYSANFSTPYEGYHLAINGTRGRLETKEFGGAGGKGLPSTNENGMRYIDYYPIFEGRERIHVPAGEGGHGGGDPLILEDIFLGEDPDRKFDILAKSADGLRAISVGDAVFTSIEDGQVQDLTGFMR